MLVSPANISAPPKLPYLPKSLNLGESLFYYLVTPAGFLSHCPWVPWGSSPILTRSSPAVSLSDSTSKSLSIEGKLSPCDDFSSKIQELSFPGFQRQREQEMPDLVSFLTALPVFSPITLLATAGSS